jgi:chorismate synthase
VAVGGLAKTFLRQFGIEVLSHVVAVGPVRLERAAAWEEIVALEQRDEVLLGCVDAETEARMKEAVDQAYRTGDTVGGVFEVVAHGLPIGLGSHIAWDTRLDGRLAQAVVSIQAVKGVEIGLAEEGAASYGSAVQDTIHYDKPECVF